MNIVLNGLSCIAKKCKKEQEIASDSPESNQCGLVKKLSQVLLNESYSQLDIEEMQLLECSLKSVERE